MMALEILHITPDMDKVLIKVFQSESQSLSLVFAVQSHMFTHQHVKLCLLRRSLEYLHQKQRHTCLRVGEEEILISHPLHLRLLKSPMQVLPLHNSCPMSILAPS